jgi:hypothetical protein
LTWAVVAEYIRFVPNGTAPSELMMSMSTPPEAFTPDNEKQAGLNADPYWTGNFVTFIFVVF